MTRAADVRRLDEVAIIAREIAGLQARMCALVAACDPGEDDAVREELACLLRISLVAADQLLTTGRELASRLPATRAALAAGQIGFEHARRIATGLLPLSDEGAAAVEADLVAAAHDCTPGRLARQVERAVVAAAPQEAARAAEAAADARDVTVYPESHGMATLVAHLTAPAAQEILLALDAAADRRRPGDERSRGARRADALHGWALAALSSGQLPARHGRPVTIQVTMSIATALGLADEPAHLAGHGPLPAPMARALAADGAWQAFLTDSVAGRVLGVGTVRYRPGRQLRDLVLARHDTCAFPHCHRPATACDLDHRMAFAQGGPTDDANLAPLCRRHHRLKTHGGWSPQAHPDGTTTWTSPHGRTYATSERRFPDPLAHTVPERVPHGPPATPLPPGGRINPAGRTATSSRSSCTRSCRSFERTS